MMINKGLCLTWLGRLREASELADRVVAQTPIILEQPDDEVAAELVVEGPQRTVPRTGVGNGREGAPDGVLVDVFALYALHF